MSKALDIIKLCEVNWPKESRWLVDGDSKETLDYSDKGDETQIGSSVEIDIGKYLGKNVIDIHTHPDNSFPSPEDWSMLFFGHAKQVRVLLKDGRAVELTKPSSLRMTPRVIKVKWQKIEDEIFNSGRSNEMTVEEIIYEINQKLAKETGIEISVKNISDYKDEPWMSKSPMEEE